jgi:hypothetical protein
MQDLANFYPEAVAHTSAITQDLLSVSAAFSQPVASSLPAFPPPVVGRQRRTTSVPSKYQTDFFTPSEIDSAIFNSAVKSTSPVDGSTAETRRCTRADDRIAEEGKDSVSDDYKPGSKRKASGVNKRKRKLGGSAARHKTASTSKDKDGVVRKGSLFSFEEIREVFHVPLAQAAKDLGICATMLKQHCRRMGLEKWPYRQIKKFTTQLQKVEAVSRKDPATVVANEAKIEKLKISLAALKLSGQVLHEDGANAPVPERVPVKKQPHKNHKTSGREKNIPVNQPACETNKIVVAEEERTAFSPIEFVVGVHGMGGKPFKLQRRQPCSKEAERDVKREQIDKETREAIKRERLVEERMVEQLLPAPVKLDDLRFGFDRFDIEPDLKGVFDDDEEFSLFQMLSS